MSLAEHLQYTRIRVVIPIWQPSSTATRISAFIVDLATFKPGFFSTNRMSSDSWKRSWSAWTETQIWLCFPLRFPLGSTPRRAGSYFLKLRQSSMNMVVLYFDPYGRMLIDFQANLLCTAQNLTNMNHPSKADYRSVVNYLNNVKPIQKTERSFIQHKEDLVTLRPGREHAWLDGVIERILRIFHCKLVEVGQFCPIYVRSELI